MMGQSRAFAAGCARVVVAGALVVSMGALPVLGQPSIERIGVRADGTQPNAPSNGPVCSNGAQCVAFYSDASNLLPQGPGGDNNGFSDVYLFDSRSDEMQRISETPDGEGGNGPSMAQRFRPSIDDGCTCVAYSTDATNLVPNDNNGRTDVILRQLDPAANLLVSVGLDGNSANGNSSFASVSADCQHVAFRSTASNLVEGDENGDSDIFVYAVATGSVARVSIPSGGGEADGGSTTPAISGDGRCVAFASVATNLLGEDTNGVHDIYVACDGEVTCRASVSSAGEQANAISFHPSLNQDGSVVAFKSEASNLVDGDFNAQPDIFVHDCNTGITERVSISNRGAEADDIAIPPSLSRDGNRVAFGSFASTLAEVATHGRSQIYVRDRSDATTILISADASGRAQNGSSPDLPPSICPNGDFVVFASGASNLDPPDTNGFQDVFAISVGDAPTPTPEPTNTPIPIACSSDTDCDPGTICGPEGICIPSPTPTPEIPCDTDDDCPMGLECVSNVCVDPNPPTPTPTQTPLPTCIMDEDCECPDGTPDEECDRCRAQFCVPPRPCEDGTVDLDCRGERETCVEGFCECGGDCNLNGLTFGTEISRMMCILGGVCEEDECITADVNEDGQVTGCDVTLAVMNLGLGCPGEGTALIFGALRTSEDRTVRIGTEEPIKAAAGEVVTVPISLEGGAEVSTVHTDILINTAEVDVEVVVGGNGAIRPDCKLADPLVGTFSDEAIRLPQVPRGPEGVRRVRVAAIDTTAPLPLDTMDEGEVLSCRFRVDAGATAGSVIPLLGDANRTEVGDFNSQPFNAIVADGAIEVVVIEGCDDDPSICPEGTMCRNDVCVADTDCETSEQCLDRQACVPDPEMSGVNSCECLGDCNLDGRVRSNEITAMINIINGVADATTCLPADQDGDGRVRANDVTAAILNINNGCPGQP